MKFSAAAVLAAVAGVQAFSNVTYTTEVVTAVTTFCPEATELTYGGTTYTITEATTLTIKDCPCTISRAVTVVPSVVCHTCAPVSKPTWAPAKNNTAPTAPGVAAPTAAPPATTKGPITAGAGKAAALSGVGLAGVLGLAAFML